MKTVVLVETIWKGHHPTYYKYFCKTLAELGHQVWALCPAPEELKHWLESRCPETLERINIFKFNESSSFFSKILHHLPLSEKQTKPFRALLRWSAAARIVKDISLSTRQKPDLVFFAYVDYYYVVPELPSFFIKKVFPFNWSGLYFHPRHLRLNYKWLFNPDKMFELDNCRAVAVLDEGIRDKLSMRIKGKPVVWFPDITDNEKVNNDVSPLIRQIREKAEGRKIIGLIGNLTKHKYFLNLLDVSKKTQKRNWFFVFAGPLHKTAFTPKEWEHIQLSVKSNPNNCFFHFSYLQDGAEYNSLIAEVDVLSAAHINFPHSSNTLTKAAIFEKPVVVDDGYCLAERVRKYKLGQVIPVESSNAYIKALERLLQDKASPPTKRQFKEYRELHSHGSLVKSFQELLSFY